MKVGKEELMGLLAAVERYLKVDHAAERRKLESRATQIIEKLSKIQGLSVCSTCPKSPTTCLTCSWNGRKTA